MLGFIFFACSAIIFLITFVLITVEFFKDYRRNRDVLSLILLLVICIVCFFMSFFASFYFYGTWL